MLPMRHEELEAGLNDLTGAVVDAAIHVHKALGPGLLEKTYRVCLMHELARRGIPAAEEVAAPVRYGDQTVESGLRLDLLVADKVIVEVKAVNRLHPVHFAQLLTYLKVTGHSVGLLLNFNAFPLTIRRLVRADS